MKLWWMSSVIVCAILCVRLFCSSVVKHKIMFIGVRLLASPFYAVIWLITRVQELLVFCVGFLQYLWCHLLGVQPLSYSKKDAETNPTRR